GGAGVETADVLLARKRPAVRRRPHVRPRVLRRVVQPHRRAAQEDAPAPLVAVPERAAREVDEAAIGKTEGIGAVGAADAGGRGRREALLPGARFQIESEQMEPLRDAVVSPEVDPFFREGVERPGALPAEHRCWLLVGGALLDPLIDGMARPVDFRLT